MLGECFEQTALLAFIDLQEKKNEISYNQSYLPLLNTLSQHSQWAYCSTVQISFVAVMAEPNFWNTPFHRGTPSNRVLDSVWMPWMHRRMATHSRMTPKWGCCCRCWRRSDGSCSRASMRTNWKSHRNDDTCWWLQLNNSIVQFHSVIYIDADITNWHRFSWSTWACWWYDRIALRRPVVLVTQRNIVVQVPTIAVHSCDPAGPPIWTYSIDNIRL